MRLTIRAPMIITARLMPGVKVADGYISVAPVTIDGAGRVTWKYHIDTPDGCIGSGQEIRSGACAVPDDSVLSELLPRMAETLLSFLGADADTYAAHMGMSEPTDGYSFGARVAEWAYLNSDEITCLSMELESLSEVSA